MSRDVRAVTASATADGGAFSLAGEGELWRAEEERLTASASGDCTEDVLASTSSAELTHDASDLPVFFIDDLDDVRTTKLFVQIVSEQPFTGEEMNRHFGRYGQVSCSLLRKVAFSDGAPAGDRGPPLRKRTLLRQSFIVAVDSSINAQRAIFEAVHPEVELVAPSDQTRNRYRIADVPCEQELFVFSEVVPLEGAVLGRETNGSREEDGGFVPEVLVDNVPYHVTPHQIAEHAGEFGTVMRVRMGIDDRSGAFNGAALVLVQTPEEALAVSEGLHGRVLEGATLTCGVLDERLNLVSLRNGGVLKRPSGTLCDDVRTNPCCWL
jgi:hypothetical protein